MHPRRLEVSDSDVRIQSEHLVEPPSVEAHEGCLVRLVDRENGRELSLCSLCSLWQKIPDREGRSDCSDVWICFESHV